MFAWLNLPLIRKELTALSETVARVRAEIAEILITAEREKQEAVEFVKSSVAKATEELTAKITELEAKVQELLDQPQGELDVSSILEDLATLKTQVETIIVPDAVEPVPTEPEAEPIEDDGFDQEEFDDVPTVVLDPDVSPAEDIAVEPEA